MNIKMLIFIYLVVFLNIVIANEEYKGYKVYSIKLQNQKQQENLSTVKNDVIDYLVRPSLKYGLNGQVMVPPSHLEWFEEQLTELGIPGDVLIPDVYEYLLTKESYKRESYQKSSIDIQDFDIHRFHRYNDILNYLRSLTERFNNPTSRVELIEYGITEENRSLVYLKVTHVNTNIPTVQKPVIVVEAGMIAREWITIPAALNIVDRILADQSFIQQFDWIIMPVVNPDGYEYSQTNLRLWQKTRSTRSHLGHICPGVNINRNFDIDWLHFDTSTSPCSGYYGGIEASSEIETQMIQSIIKDYGSRIRLYLSLQNSGGFISYPWSYERAASGMFRQHHLIGLDMIKAMREAYNIDVASSIFDRASGTSTDYARNNGILYTLNVGIVERDSVIIPEDDIGDIVDDVWKAVAAAVSYLN